MVTTVEPWEKVDGQNSDIHMKLRKKIETKGQNIFSIKRVKSVKLENKKLETREIIRFFE
ncbi:hypothetical protein B0W44_10910 [Novibacillus thermophilus]|uniref:Uncharacterized protein n=1 Tax=Novibacillus thermophilus TaxID=1471761 RepID=A0A1U9K864_9BACL|nr:hypothetical protein B0W44_10910 [Novibacillus thermophilus]